MFLVDKYLQASLTFVGEASITVSVLGEIVER